MFNKDDGMFSFNKLSVIPKISKLCFSIKRVNKSILPNKPQIFNWPTINLFLFGITASQFSTFPVNKNIIKSQSKERIHVCTPPCQKKVSNLISKFQIQTEGKRYMLYAWPCFFYSFYQIIFWTSLVRTNEKSCKSKFINYEWIFIYVTRILYFHNVEPFRCHGIGPFLSGISVFWEKMYGITVFHLLPVTGYCQPPLYKSVYECRIWKFQTWGLET